jgi:hypothetical protein
VTALKDLRRAVREYEREKSKHNRLSVRNPAAELVERIDCDGIAGAVFEIPADLISFRSGHRKLCSELRQPTSTGRGELHSTASRPKQHYDYAVVASRRLTITIEATNTQTQNGKMLP